MSYVGSLDLSMKSRESGEPVAHKEPEESLVLR